MFSSVFLFFEFTPPEIFLILFVVLLLFGGDKLPGLARGLGKGIRDFKDASEGVKREINNQIDNYDAKKKEDTKPEETPLIAENSTDNAEGKKDETPSETVTPGVTPVANTVPASTTHVATDNIEHEMYDGTAESNEDLHAHYRGAKHARETTIPGVEPEKKANE